MIETKWVSKEISYTAQYALESGSLRTAMDELTAEANTGQWRIVSVTQFPEHAMVVDENGDDTAALGGLMGTTLVVLMQRGQ